MYQTHDAMAVNGLLAIINTPEALEGDRLHQLPPHKPIPAYVVDKYPACPDIWEHGSDKASSYFVSLEAGKGMWFDFTDNQINTHHVAVVISVQGVNPITGKPITELNLVQYKSKCPIHDVDFRQDRYCPECKYGWPAQNYIATTTGESHLWLDGFRNENGEVRQYIISEDQAKGIAKQVEDRDPEFKRVWAIGFAFYLSKESRPRITLGGQSRPCNLGANYGDVVDMDFDANSLVLDQNSFMQQSKAIGGGGSSSCSSHSMSSMSQPTPTSFAPPPHTPLRRSRSLKSPSDIEKVVETKKLEVGAGARIKQDIGVDSNDIDFWQPEPAGMIYVNFVGEEALQQILDAGVRQDKEEGPLDGMKVGNK